MENVETHTPRSNAAQYFVYITPFSQDSNTPPSPPETHEKKRVFYASNGT